MKRTNLFLSLIGICAILAFTACSDDDNGTEIEIVDTDNDGVADADDNCPDVAGPVSNDGCPETPEDADADGIIDDNDSCPTEAGPASNDGCPEPEFLSMFLVTATSGENDYIVSADELSATTTFDATSAEAVQSPGNRIWTFYKDEVLYGFLYNQADAGTTASYVLNDDGTISKRNELALGVSIHIYEEIGDHLVLAYSDRLREPEVAQQAFFYRVDPTTDASQEFTLTTDDLLEEGEVAYFTDIAEYEGKIILGARSVNSSAFTSDYYNNTYVVVLNDDFTFDQVIKDTGRTGFVAGQKFSQGDTGLEVVENGDLYAFSAGQTSFPDAETVTVPSGILKINQGTFEFDSDYFFNITEASGGHNLFRAYYTGGTSFVLAMYPGTNADATFGVDADRFAVVDVAAETFEWVTNFPENALPDWQFRTPYVDTENGQLIVSATPSEGKHYVYAIDPTTAEATQLSEVVGEGVRIVGKLTTEIGN